MQRVPGPLGTVTEGHGNRPKVHGSVDFSPSSSTDQADVPSLAPPSDVSPPSAPDPRRNSHSLPLWASHRGHILPVLLLYALYTTLGLPPTSQTTRSPPRP